MVILVGHTRNPNTGVPAYMIFPAHIDILGAALQSEFDPKDTTRPAACTQANCVFVPKPDVFLLAVDRQPLVSTIPFAREACPSNALQHVKVISQV